MAKAVKKTTKKVTTKTAKKAAPRKKKAITNLIIIDASGSMSSKKDEVVGGLKELLSQIRKDMEKDKNKVNMTNIIVDFSSSGDFRVLVNSSSAADLQDSIAENYTTRGMTALNDAIGKGFRLVDKNQYGVFVNIITDGLENDSKEFTGADIKKVIDEAKGKSWAVTFMGTTESSVAHAQSLGISRGNTMTFADNSAGVKMSMRKTMAARSMYYAGVSGTSGTSGFSHAYDTLGSGTKLDNILAAVNAQDDDDKKLNKVTKK